MNAAGGRAATGAPLGVIPAGAGNDLARTLGIPRDAQAATDVIGCRNLRRIGLGDVSNHYFSNVASIGLSVQLARTEPQRQATPATARLRAGRA